MLPNEMEIVIGGATHHYSLQSLADGRSIRRDMADTNLALPNTFTVAHSTTGKGTNAIDSYLIRLDKTVATEVDASSNVQSSQTLSVYFVVKVPRGINGGATLAANQGYALANHLTAVISGSTIRVLPRILGGEL